MSHLRALPIALLFVISLLSSLLVSTALAEEKPAAGDALWASLEVPEAPSPDQAPAQAPPALPRGLWVFFFGAAAVAATGFLLQKYRDQLRPPGLSSLHHVQTMKLGTRHMVSLVEVDDRRLLIGLCDGAITLLSDLGPSSQAPTTAAAASPPEQAANKRRLWEEALSSARAASTQDGLFADAPAAAPAASPADERRRETDSVLIGLKKLEERYGAAR